MMRRPLAFLLLCVACNSYQAPLPPAPRDATLVSASAGLTWDAVVDLFAARNIPIRTIERASGFVATDELSVGAEGRKWADCGKLNSVRLGPERAIYNVLVRGDSASSSVKATVRWTYSAAKLGVIECATSHAWEEGFEAEVKAHAEGGHAAGDAAALSPGVAPATVPPAPGAGSDGPSRGAANARPNNLLLSFDGFSRAMGDMRRKGMILGYREAALERLEVDLTARAFGEPTLEYQLTRLFLAYGATMDEDTQPTLVVRANGQQVGLYTRSGLQWDGVTGRR
jgi:hypothetical protein